jgi:C-terminal processing protease CtpA/Prc
MSNEGNEHTFEDDAASVELDNAIPVAKFLQQRQPLDFSQCLALVSEAIRVLEGLYVHLPVKRSMYGVDPVRRLQLLRLRLEQPDLLRREAKEHQAPSDDMWFHREMTDALTSVRDLHTLYLLPKPFDTAVALVPFQIEDCLDGGQTKYLVSNVIEDLPWFKPPKDFQKGVEATHWNGIPIARAVELAGVRNAGSNPDAMLARGLARMTIRPLAKAVPPDEEWVTLHYKNAQQEQQSLSVQWRVVVVETEDMLPPDGATIQDSAEGLDYETDIIRILNKRLYSRYREKKVTWSLRQTSVALSQKSGLIEDTQEIPLFSQSLLGIIEAKSFLFSDKRYGYIRLRSFKVLPINVLPVEFARLMSLMPENGLIIDIRDNPGGYIAAGEQLLQMLTANAIQPEPAQLINTPLSLAICDNIEEYIPWRPSIRRALATGTTFSSTYPITDPLACNDVGQQYYGPVILITSALCYSTSDIFAAGFQDHAIGKILGIHNRTGAGGANVVTHSRLRKACEAAGARDLLSTLPAGDLRFAIRRTLRVGANAGTELEDLGVRADIAYQRTRNDLLGDNADLIRKAAGLLAQSGKPFYRLRETIGSVKRSGNTVTAEIETRNFTRLDLAVDGWTGPSLQVRDGVHQVSAGLPPSGTGKILELRGFDDASQLVAARKVPLDRHLSGGVAMGDLT